MNLPLGEFMKEKMGEYDPEGRLSPRSRRRIEQTIQHEFDQIQQQKLTLAVGAVIGAKTGVKGVPKGQTKATEPTKTSINSTQEVKTLLPGEGTVGTFKKLKNLETPGDDLTPHHMPHDQYMRYKGVNRADGVSMNIEQPTPGTGGRHREIHKTLSKQDTTLAPRDALAQSVNRVREVYRQDGLLNEIRPSLQEVIKSNKEQHPNLFKKNK